MTAAGVDLGRLRDERLARLQEAMRHHDIEVCLLFNEPNIRYATGASAMPVYAMSTFVRCAVVPAEGTPILFEHGNSIHRSGMIARDVRPMHAWEFFDDPGAEAEIWAREVADAVDGFGVRDRSLAVDRLGTPGFLALQHAGFSIVDSAPVSQEAREIKTPEEIRAFRANVPMVMQMLKTFEGALRPGVRELDLLAELSGVMVRGGGEYLATNTVCSGPNTNPWRSEATDRRVEAGDLVYVDTDTVGIGGCFYCVSRTFLCGEEPPTSEQRATYAVARGWLEEMTSLVVPGITCGELAERAPKIPDRYLAQRYECMIHGAGLEEESPSVCHPQDPQSNAERLIQESMVLVVEIYAGEPGATHGVKLGDEVLVTAEGTEVLAPYPFDERLS